MGKGMSLDRDRDMDTDLLERKFCIGCRTAPIMGLAAMGIDLNIDITTDLTLL